MDVLITTCAQRSEKLQDEERENELSKIFWCKTQFRLSNKIWFLVSQLRHRIQVNFLSKVFILQIIHLPIVPAFPCSEIAERTSFSQLTSQVFSYVTMKISPSLVSLIPAVLEVLSLQTH